MIHNQKHYYHGTTADIKDGILSPQPSRVVDMESVVFAARTRWIAIVFAAKWKDDTLQFGVSGNQYILRECFPGAFDVLKTSGFVHTVSSAPFFGDQRLGMFGDEFITQRSVPILETERIPCILTALRATPELKMLSHDTPSPWPAPSA